MQCSKPLQQIQRMGSMESSALGGGSRHTRHPHVCARPAAAAALNGCAPNSSASPPKFWGSHGHKGRVWQEDADELACRGRGALASQVSMPLRSSLRGGADTCQRPSLSSWEPRHALAGPTAGPPTRQVPCHVALPHRQADEPVAQDACRRGAGQAGMQVTERDHSRAGGMTVQQSGACVRAFIPARGRLTDGRQGLAASSGCSLIQCTPAHPCTASRQTSG